MERAERTMKMQGCPIALAVHDCEECDALQNQLRLFTDWSTAHIVTAVDYPSPEKHQHEKRRVHQEDLWVFVRVSQLVHEPMYVQEWGRQLP